MDAPRSTSGLRAGALGLVAALALAACASAPEVTAPPSVQRGQALPVELGDLTARDVGRAHTAFGFDLLHLLCAQAPGENTTVSPTSAALALGLLHPAARGATADTFGDLLHLPAWSPELAAALQAHDADLARLTPELTADEQPAEDDAPDDGDEADDDGPDTLRISNRVWPAVGVEPDQDYLDAVATAFDAAVETLDYADPSGSARDRINDSISQDTAGMIDPLLDKLDPGTVMVLTNAVHLEARWAAPFESTHDGAFTTPHGTVETPMMSGAGGTLQEHDGWQAVTLPYRDGTLEALAVLPPSGTEPCGLDAATLDGLDESPSHGVAVAMPQLDIEQRHELLPTLEELGLDRSGDYSGLGAAAQISQVVQEVALRVDEDGTEAAAATAVVLILSAREYTEIDRPFLLLLRDTRTGSPLMVSVVNDPTA